MVVHVLEVEGHPLVAPQGAHEADERQGLVPWARQVGLWGTARRGHVLFPGQTSRTSRSGQSGLTKDHALGRQAGPVSPARAQLGPTATTSRREHFLASSRTNRAGNVSFQCPDVARLLHYVMTVVVTYQSSAATIPPLNWNFVAVEVTGFEPATSTMRT